MCFVDMPLVQQDKYGTEGKIAGGGGQVVTGCNSDGNTTRCVFGPLPGSQTETPYSHHRLNQPESLPLGTVYFKSKS